MDETMGDLSFALKADLSKLQQTRWEKQRNYLAAHSDYYRNVTLPERLEDLPSVPFTTKDALRQDQAEHAPFGSYLAAKKDQVIRLHRTSGTTGRAIHIALSRADALQMAEVGGRAHRTAGLWPGMMVAHCLNYKLWMGGFTDHTTLESAGATVVPYGVGDTEMLVRTIKDLKIQALFCTASYPAILEQTIADKFPNLRPRDLGLTLALLTGESGLENPSFRARLEDTWGFKARNIYGISDVLTVMSGNCEFDDNMHFVCSDAVFPELINPETGAPISWAEGNSGELVVTHLQRECQPLVRFRTSDIVQLTSEERCQCGRHAPRFRVLGRSDDMIIVRGVNIFPGSLIEIINRFPELSGQFQILLSGPPPYDRLPVHVELENSAQSEERLAMAVGQAMREKVGARVEVQLLPPGSIARTEGKSKRVVRR